MIDVPFETLARRIVRGVLVLVCVVSSQLAAAQSARDPRDGAGAQPVAGPQPETSDKPSDTPGTPSIQSSLRTAGDPGGLRAALAKQGITYSATYVGEGLANLTGGFKRAGVAEGRLDLQFDADLERVLGWQGAALHANAYQIHGLGLSRAALGNLTTVSGIEALPSTRLFELWFEQKVFDDRVGIRAGQLAADTEFLVSQYGSLFVNATFGWPTITAADLPSGGPAYPLATPAVRLKLAPTDNVSILAGLFNGDPAGPTPGPLNPFIDPQRRNRSGTSFRVGDPGLLILEGAYSYNQEKDAAGLPGIVKIGGWHHLGHFTDERFDTAGLSLADPASTGLARSLRGNSGLYGVIDQTLYRIPGTTDQGLGVFLRASGSPADRNVVSTYVDGGLVYKGLIPGREDDTMGVSFALAQVSGRLRAYDADVRSVAALAQSLSGEAGPLPLVRSSEVLLEATYQAQIVPGWTVQPDLQYIIRPGAHVANPRDSYGRAEKNAAVIGLRTSIRY